MNQLKRWWLHRKYKREMLENVDAIQRINRGELDGYSSTREALIDAATRAYYLAAKRLAELENTATSPAHKSEKAR